MATAKALLEGATLSKTGGTLIYHVSGLDGGEQQAMAQALDVPPIQQLSQPHPFINNIKVISEPTVTEVFQGDGSIICRVTVQYGQDESEQAGSAGGGDGSEFSLTTTTLQETTSFDASGNVIIVRFEPAGPNNIFQGQAAPAGQPFPPQTGEVKVMVTLMTLRVVRKEKELPLKSQLTHAGTLNSKIFLDQPAEFWYMSNYGATTTDGGRSYTVTREFTGNPRGWLRGAQFIVDGKNPAVLAGPKEFHFIPPHDDDLKDIGGQAAGLDQRQFGGLTVVRVQYLTDFNKMEIVLPKNIDQEIRDVRRRRGGAR